MFGLPADMAAALAAPAAVDVYPENWAALQLMLALATQWHQGFNGKTGLIYASVPIVMDLNPPADRQDTFAALQVIEREMLAAWRKQRE
jgi:hypothetical protein